MELILNILDYYKGIMDMDINIKKPRITGDLPVIEDLPKSSITGKFVDDYFSRNSKKLPTPKLFFISIYTSSPIVANECYTQLRPIIKGSNKIFPYTQVKSVIDIGVVGNSKNDALEILDSYLKQTGISKSTYTTKICN